VIDHVDIRASELEASERFYDTVLPVIGKQRLSAEGYAEWGDSSVHPPSADNPVTRRLHVGFYATTRELVDAFHRAGTEAGYRDDGHPNRAPRTGPTPTAAVCSTPTATASKRQRHAGAQAGRDRRPVDPRRYWELNCRTVLPAVITGGLPGVLMFSLTNSAARREDSSVPASSSHTVTVTPPSPLRNAA
jgi:catechol 2,3-dioxygenase-like lactoylglutathione lyase family enzyme